MTKSLTINIGGQLFEIDQSAYEQLRQYINSLENHFKNDPDGKEIVEDIEMRIAELFTELQTEEFKIILKEQVEFVKLKMGTVDEFDPIDEAYVDDQESQQTTSKPSTKSSTTTNTQIIKKLMRDPDDRVLGGVCAGLGHYFNVNPVIIRIILLILFFGLAFGLLAYLLMWIIIPKASTTTAKLMMKGQPINLNTVADSVKEENLRTGDSPLFNFIGQLIQYLGRLLFAIGKVLLIIVSLTLLIAAFAGIIVVGVGLLKGGILTQSMAIGPAPLVWLMKLLSIIAFGVPLLLLIIGLIYLLLNRNYFKSTFTLPLLGIWLISVFGLSLYSKAVAKDFKEESTIKEVFELEPFYGDTLYVGVLESNIETFTIGYRNNFSITTESIVKLKDSLYINNVVFDIKPSANNRFNLLVEKTAKGTSKPKAKDRAEQTNYVWKQDNDHVLLNSFLGVDKQSKWRQQKVSLTLQVPEYSYVHLGQKMDWLLEDVDNVQDMYDSEMADQLWQMTAAGLSCISCDANHITSSKKEEKQNYNTFYMSEDAFHTFDIEGAFEVTVEQSNTPQILFNGKEEAPNHIEINRNNIRKKLSIESKKSKHKTNIIIRTPQLTLLNFSGAGKLNIVDFTGNDVELNFEGATASEIELDCDKLELNVDGVSSHKLSGQANELTATINGANHINARKFKVATAEIDIEGTNSASFWVTDALAIQLDGLNTASYRGNPTIEEEVSFTSSLKQE